MLNRKHGQQCVSFWQVGQEEAEQKWGSKWTAGNQPCLKVTMSDWRLIRKEKKRAREAGEKRRSEEQNQKPQPLIWVIARKFGSQKTCTSGCFSNAKMVSFMGPNKISWQTWLNRKMDCISTPGKRASTKSQKASAVYAACYYHSVLLLVTAMHQKKQEPQVMYTPQPIIQVISSQQMPHYARLNVTFLCGCLGGLRVFTNTFSSVSVSPSSVFWLTQGTQCVMTVLQNEIIN